jgi:hypothetical protein
MLGAAGPDRPRQQSLPCWRSFNPLFIQKSRIDRATTRRAHRGGRRAGVEHWDGAVYGACRSTQCCLVVSPLRFPFS